MRLILAPYLLDRVLDGDESASLIYWIDPLDRETEGEMSSIAVVSFVR
jgi:hypothetical protein